MGILGRIFGSSRRVAQTGKVPRTEAEKGNPDLEAEIEKENQVIADATKIIRREEKTMASVTKKYREIRSAWVSFRVIELMKERRIMESQAQSEASKEFDEKAGELGRRRASGFQWEATSMSSRYDSQFDPVFTGGYMAYKGNTGL